MSITYKLNKDKNGVEIKFTEKPSEKVRARLKELGFRWSQYQGVWYAKQSEETIAFAKELASEEGEQIALSIPTVNEVEEPKKAVSVESIQAERKAKTEQKVKAISEAKKNTGKSKKIDPDKGQKKEASSDEKSASQKAYEEYRAKTEKAEKSEPKSKKDNIVIFPKSRPDVKVAVTDGEWTYNDCKAKLEYERKIFCDSDSQFVIDGLLKMCEVNQNFRNNVMRKDKSYQGAFEYFMNMARKGFALQYNGVTYLDNNIALGFAMDYFNSADVPSNVVNGAIVK